MLCKEKLDIVVDAEARELKPIEKGDGNEKEK